MKRTVASLTTLVTLSGPAFAGAQDWSGFYLGANGAYEHVENDASIWFSSGQSNSDMAALGLIGGYNHAVNDWVFGIEAEASLPLGRFDSRNLEFSTEWRAALRARAGRMISADSLAYLMGGAVMERNTCECDSVLATDKSKTYSGFEAGAGIEHAVSDNITVRGEYLFSNFGKESHYDGYDTVTNSIMSQAVRIGVSYQF